MKRQDRQNILKRDPVCEFKSICSFLSNKVICIKFKCVNTQRGIRWRHSSRWGGRKSCCMMSVCSTTPYRRTSTLSYEGTDGGSSKLRMIEPFDTETNAVNSVFTQRWWLWGPLEHWAYKHYSAIHPWMKRLRADWKLKQTHPHFFLATSLRCTCKYACTNQTSHRFSLKLLQVDVCMSPMHLWSFVWSRNAKSLNQQSSIDI